MGRKRITKNPASRRDEIWVEAVQSYLKDGSRRTAKLLNCQSEIHNPKSEIRPAGGGFLQSQKLLAFYEIPD